MVTCCALAAPGCRDSGSGGNGTGGSDGGDGSGEDGGSEGVDALCDDRLPGRRIRRLSHAEYAATMSTLFGTSAPPVEMAADNVVHGYDNNAGALSVSGLLADQYRVAAEAVADELVADLGEFLPCDPADGEAACAEAFVQSFGRRLFRRPLTATEVQRYTDLYAELEAEDGFTESLRWIIAGMLQSPYFLYRTELGTPQEDGTVHLTSHEIASALSYLVIGTMPDAELAAAADSDALLELDERLAQADRLVHSDAAVSTQLEFANAWLGLGLLEQAQRDADLFPGFTAEIRSAMRGEVERLFANVFVSGGSFADLLETDQSYWTDGLADFYGQAPGAGSADADGFRQVELSGDPGILSRGALMATHALPSTPSPIHRGVMVRERLLCNELPPPPPGVANGIPEIDPDSSNRERYTIHSADPACAGCHNLIDSIGFGFEHYDAVGRWQDTDGVHEIDASGNVSGIENSDFDGAGELAGVLAHSDAVTDCYAEQWSRHALGGLAQDDGLVCMADQVAARFLESDGRLDSVVAALVSSRGFVVRHEGDAAPPLPDPPDDDGADDDGADGDTGEPPPPANPDLEVEVVQASQWPTGECNDVIVTNISDAPVEWEIDLPVNGAITTAWSCLYVEADGTATFTGEPFNANLEPGWAAMFGFCSATE